MSLTCDPWHYTGPDMNPKSYTKEEKLISLCKLKLPQLTQLLDVGSTGYPINEHLFKCDYGYTYDSVGRLYIITPDYYIFQRYLSGNMLLISDRSKIDYKSIDNNKLDYLITYFDE